MLKFFPLKAALVGRSRGTTVYVILSLLWGFGYSIVKSRDIILPVFPPLPTPLEVLEERILSVLIFMYFFRPCPQTNVIL
jgi:hypothetical protein